MERSSESPKSPIFTLPSCRIVFNVEKKESRLFVEIKKLNCLHDEDVRWLQVSMDDSQVVDKDQTIQKLSCHVERAKSPKLQITLVSLEIDERGNIVEQ